ncbi:hypothetical protein IHC92_17250 [Photobacterium damselae subsp. damselae]|uniref:hypothetical protein n=1 Tax=Photobacterium damselae TaxID=38293 RepID=UPI001F3A81FF|nr:hypothetical protein [Photobacterium damselae]UKA23909.1 hypothetical protein IHC92_17250 [Photobacterium damselae subsp. damselae]
MISQKIKANKLNLNINGDNSSGVFAHEFSHIKVINSDIISNGNNDYGIHAKGNETVIDAENINLISNNSKNSSNIVSEFGGNINIDGEKK